jgi:hypothetical protein
MEGKVWGESRFMDQGHCQEERGGLRVLEAVCHQASVELVAGLATIRNKTAAIARRQMFPSDQVEDDYMSRLNSA